MNASDPNRRPSTRRVLRAFLNGPGHRSLHLWPGPRSELKAQQGDDAQPNISLAWLAKALTESIIWKTSAALA